MNDAVSKFQHETAQLHQVTPGRKSHKINMTLPKQTNFVYYLLAILKQRNNEQKLN